MRRFLLSWASIGFLAFSQSPLNAQDRILLQQAGGSRIPMTGFVEDYNGREISIRTKPDDPVRRYPRADVIEVITECTPHHEKARKLLTAGKVTEAKKEYTAALDDENRTWVRREILSGQVKCALWNGDYLTAVLRFLPIAESDPETFHFQLIPLNWTDDEPNANLRNDARQWAALSSPPLNRLIGASWLMTLPDASSDAEQILKRLAREPDVRIQRLAQMQLWRAKFRKGEQIDQGEIQRWERFIEGIPVELRGGPHFVIGQAWKQSQEYERAARAFLWLPLVYDADRWLSSRACFEAAESMELLGDSAQAQNLYSEVVFRYGDTPWGPAAETAWKAIRQANSSK
jgi:hypothetical protein